MLCSRTAGCDPHLSGQDLSVIKNLVRSAFGWVLRAGFPDHCLSFYFTNNYICFLSFFFLSF